MAETIYRLRRAHGTWSGKRMGDIRRAIVQSLDEMIEDYDPAIPFPGNDADDRHLHAAAVAGHVDILLTDDLGFHDLLEGDAAKLPYEILHPDDFFVLFDDSAPRVTMRVVDEQRAYWAKKQFHMGLADALRGAGCPRFADRVTGHLRTLSGPR